MEVDQLNKDQEDEKRAWEEEQAEIKKAKEDEDQEYVPGKERDWSPYQYKAFATKNVQFVLCMNTMGQDQEFPQDKIDYALKCIQHYKGSWERIE